MMLSSPHQACRAGRVFCACLTCRVRPYQARLPLLGGPSQFTGDEVQYRILYNSGIQALPGVTSEVDLNPYNYYSELLLLYKKPI